MSGATQPADRGFKWASELGTPPRWGVYSRRGPRDPWRLVAEAGDHRGAERLMIRLAGEACGSADWCVRRVGEE
jgi:hypothetical protein